MMTDSLLTRTLAFAAALATVIVIPALAQDATFRNRAGRTIGTTPTA